MRHCSPNLTQKNVLKEGQNIQSECHKHKWPSQIKKTLPGKEIKFSRRQRNFISFPESVFLIWLSWDVASPLKRFYVWRRNKRFQGKMRNTKEHNETQRMRLTKGMEPNQNDAPRKGNKMQPLTAEFNFLSWERLFDLAHLGCRITVEALLRLTPQRAFRMKEAKHKNAQRDTANARNKRNGS